MEAWKTMETTNQPEPTKTFKRPLKSKVGKLCNTCYMGLFVCSTHGTDRYSNSWRDNDNEAELTPPLSHFLSLLSLIFFIPTWVWIPVGAITTANKKSHAARVAEFLYLGLGGILYAECFHWFMVVCFFLEYSCIFFYYNFSWKQRSCPIGLSLLRPFYPLGSVKSLDIS